MCYHYPEPSLLANSKDSLTVVYDSSWSTHFSRVHRTLLVNFIQGVDAQMNLLVINGDLVEEAKEILQ